MAKDVEELVLIPVLHIADATALKQEFAGIHTCPDSPRGTGTSLSY